MLSNCISGHLQWLLFPFFICRSKLNISAMNWEEPKNKLAFYCDITSNIIKTRTATERLVSPTNVCFSCRIERNNG